MDEAALVGGGMDEQQREPDQRRDEAHQPGDAGVGMEPSGAGIGGAGHGVDHVVEGGVGDGVLALA